MPQKKPKTHFAATLIGGFDIRNAKTKKIHLTLFPFLFLYAFPSSQLFACKAECRENTLDGRKQDMHVWCSRIAYPSQVAYKQTLL